MITINNDNRYADTIWHDFRRARESTTPRSSYDNVDEIQGSASRKWALQAHDGMPSSVTVRKHSKARTHKIRIQKPTSFQYIAILLLASLGLAHSMLGVQLANHNDLLDRASIPALKGSADFSTHIDLTDNETVEPTRTPTMAPTLSAPGIASILVEANRTSLLARVLLLDSSSVGTVYCAAFPTTYALAVVTEITSRNHFAAVQSGAAVVTIPGLYASTNYKIYCTTTTTSGASLTLAQIKSSATATNTLCCKIITVNILHKTVMALTSIPAAISISLDAPPTDSLRAVVSLAGGSTYPSLFTWASSSSVSAPQMLIANAGVSPGAQLVTIELSGTSASEYSIRYVSGQTIFVVPSTEEPALPELQSVTFSNDGTYVSIVFNAATNKGGYSNSFPCPKLLTFSGSATSTCRWADSATIRIFPQAATGSGSGSVLSVGSEITLVGEIITADCSAISTDASCDFWQKVPSVTVQVGSPIQPTAPVVSISAPASVSVCNKLVIDLAGSSGSAGRSWSSATFRVTSGGVVTPAAHMLQTFLNRNYTLNPPTPVPSTQLQAGTVYSIQATLCNFLGACGTNNVPVTVTVLPAQDLIPIVSILGAAQRSIFRSVTLTLTSNAYTQACGGSPSYSNLDLTWSITSPSGDENAVNIRSNSVDPTVFRLMPFTLKVGHQYSVVLIVRSRLSGLSSTAEVTVAVAAASLVARIAGGAQRSVKFNSSITLDASSSYDEDVQGLFGSEAGLTFSWTCVQSQPALLPDCPLTLPSPGSDSYGERLTIAAPLSALNTTSLLTLTVRGASLTRSATAEVSVKVTGFVPAVLTITSALTSVASVNTDNKLVLYGSVQTYASCNAVWSVNDANVRLSQVATTPTSVLLPASIRPVAVNLVVAGGTLPQRATLVFTLTCGSSANSLSVTTNGAPLPGVFLVEPTEGDELRTLFQFSAAQWTDPDLPLTYQFGFESVASLANLVVVSVSELSFTSSTLPAGADEESSRLNCTLNVFDSFGASAFAIKSVEVNKISESEQRDALLSLVKSGSGSVDGAKNIISMVSAAMNSVNCSAAPNCSEINRNPCLKTSGECGACLDGYIGDYGDRSTLCIPASFGHSNTSVADCSTQVDCLSWQECDPDLRICVSPQKVCSKDCSNNGECIYTSLVTGATLSNCSLADLTCAAACSCSDGFSGPTCATPLSDLQSRREIRSNLVSVLYNLTAMENADKQSVSAWSASLYSVALNPYDLSVSDADRVLQIANSTVSSARALSLDSASSLVGVLQATDTVFSVQKSNYIPNDFNDMNSVTRSYQNNTAQGIIEVVSAFAELQSQLMVLGEASATHFYDNFRVSSQLQPFGADAANVTISSPQSDFEQLTDAPVASAVLTPSDSSSSGTSSVAVSVIAVSPRAYSPDTSKYKSSPLYLQIVADSGEEASSAVSNIEFSFPFNERQEQFVSYQPVNFTFFCDHLDDEFTFKCPDSDVLLTSDCTTGRGEYTKFCPKPSPTCAQLDTASAEVSVAESCRVVSYNATYVTCSCVVSASAVNSGRRNRNLASGERDIIDNSGVSNMIATAVYISLEFADTFNAAGDFTDPAAVLIVIIMFATLWGAGLVLLSFCFGKSYMAMQKKLHLLSQQVVAAISNVEAGQSLEDARDRLLLYIDNVIPSVYSDDKSNAVRLFSELRSHHRYLTLFTLGDGQKTTFNKILLILQVLTMETMQMFLLAMFYDLEQPDDDKSCPTYLNESDCLDRKTIFDSSQTYCKWDVNPSTGAETCSFHDPDMSGTVFIYILILTSIFTAIINTPLDHFFKVCAAPLIEDALEDRVVNSMRNDRAGIAAVTKGLRRLSVQTNQAMQAAGRRGAAALVTTQKLMQKKFSLKSMHLSSKEKEADSVIADRAISEDLQQMHKHAVAGMTGLVQHTNTLQDQRERHSQRLLMKAQSKRNMVNATTDGTESPSKELELREPRKNTDTSMISATHRSVSATQISTKTTNGPEAGAELRKVMLKLQDEVLCQRLLLPAQSQHLVAYDAQWGIVPVSEDVHCISDEALDSIAVDVEYSEKEAKDLNERMQYYTLQHGGLSILNLFLVDLLGRRTIAAKIFKNKFEEDFQETRAVSQAYKAFAVALLLGCNAFFIYYTLLKALQKGHAWQVHFLQGCIAQMLVEIFLNETLECVWLNYMVPDLARKEVQRVHTVLRQVIEQITDKANDVHKKTVLFLNAPAYLFSSTKVAQTHAHLLESVVVLNFQSHLPGELSRTWPHYKRWAAVNAKDEMLVDPDAALVGNNSPHKRVRNFLFQAILAVSTAFVLSMQYLGTLSFNIQRIVIRFIQPVLLSALTLLWLFASTSPVALYVVIGVTALFLVAVFWRQHYMHELEQRTLKQIVPVDESNDLRDSASEHSSDEASSSSSDEEEDQAGNLHEAKVKKSQYVSKKFRAAAKKANPVQDSDSSDSDELSAPRNQTKQHKQSKALRRSSSHSNDSSCSSKSQPSSRSGLQISITAGALQKHHHANTAPPKRTAASVARSSTTPGGALSETSEDSNTEDEDESSDDSSPNMHRFSQRISQRARTHSEAQQERARGRTETWDQELEEIMQTANSDIESEEKASDSAERERMESGETAESGGASERAVSFADIPLDSVKFEAAETNENVLKSESEEGVHSGYVSIDALPEDQLDHQLEAKELGDSFDMPHVGSNDPMAAFDSIFPPIALHPHSPKGSQPVHDSLASRSRAETWGAELDEIMQAGSDDDPDLATMYDEPIGGESAYVRRRVKSTRSKHPRKSQRHPEVAPPMNNIPASGHPSPRISQRARADSQASESSVPKGRTRGRADSHVSEASVTNRSQRARTETWGDELDEIMRAGSDDDEEPDAMSLYEDLVQNSGKEVSYFDDVEEDHVSDNHTELSYGTSSRSDRARGVSFDVRGKRRFESFDAPSPEYSEEDDGAV